MFILFKHFVYSVSTAIMLCKHNNKNIFFKVFIIRFFYAFDFIRNILKPTKFSLNNFYPNHSFKKKVNGRRIIKDLNNKGFNDSLLLKKPYVDNLENEINLQNSSITFKGEKSKKNTYKFLKSLKKKDHLKTIFKKSKSNKIPHVAIDIDISKTKFIRELATSSFFLQLAKDYINSNKISVSGQCYISNPLETSEKEKQDYAQHFHYDLDFKKFFKIFIYLNDVDKQGGPHSFIVKSNKKKNFEHIISKRIDDYEVKKKYNFKNIKTFQKKRGSLLIEDTFGLHKGNVPKKKSRKMMILIYGEGLGINNYKYSYLT